MSFKPPHLTPNFIVADGLDPSGPLEIWVDWISGVDVSFGRQEGIAHWEGEDLILAGGLRARRIVGLHPHLASRLKEQGGQLVAALASGEISRLSFAPVQAQ